MITSNENPTPDDRQSLEAVYFGFNQYALEGKNRDILQRHAEWIKQRPNARVQIEGHCDQRGSVEYNLALGERRALTVKKYLEKLGVPSSQLSTISYGHQRPSDPRMTSEAYSKNRRAEFKVSK
ncbi:MAG: peptidoglycan-associated lipoprotein Pal [Myxococcales bacterium]|nr:peptidoglycan-associated lipoprotein Pal [Myxococcales bacterium]